MTPTTPTGKRLSDRLAYDASPERYLPGDYLREYHEAILVIEAEKEAEVLSRLRDTWDGWQEFEMPPDVRQAMDSGDIPHIVWRLLTSEDDR